jgi:ligand-binding sensor domain-containing protein
VTALQQVGDTIWCATGAGLSSFAGGAWLNRASLLGVAARALALHQDTLWAATAAGPRRMSDGAFQIVATGYLGAGRALYSDGGDLYAGSTGGVFRYSGGAWVWTDGGLPSNTVHAVGGAGGRLWAGTEAGLARFDGGTPAWTAILSQGPAVNGSQRATTDSRGVWIVTGNFFAPATGAGAVLHFDGAAWTTITAVSTAGAFQAADAFAVLSDRAGTLWFGHCCSASDPKPRVDRWNPAADVWDRPATTNIYALALSPDGRVFAGSVEHGNGVYEFDPGTAALLDSLTPANTQGGIGPGLTSNNLRGIAFDARGRGWFATFNTGLDIWDERGTIGDHADDVWVHLGTGFPSVQTTAVVTDGPASGWVGTVAGVARVVNELVNPFVTTAVTAALPSPQVKDLALDSSGNLWVATAGGLARVEAGTAAVERFTADDGLAGNDVRALAWDPARGVLWAGTTEGVSEIHPGTSAGPAFGSDAYLYPNPVGAGSGALRVGGLTGEVHGEIRDLQGGVVRDFRCDPAQNVAWDLRLPDGTPAAAGVYLVVLRDGRQSRILRAAVVR